MNKNKEARNSSKASTSSSSNAQASRTAETVILTNELGLNTESNSDNVNTESNNDNVNISKPSFIELKSAKNATYKPVVEIS